MYHNLTKWLAIICLLILLPTCIIQNKEPDFDIIVYGATPSGVIAAYAAAKEGRSVLLIEQKGHVGGMNTSGLNTAETEHMIHQSITGYADMVYQILGTQYDSSDFEFSKRLRDLYLETGRAYAYESKVIEQVFLDLLMQAGVTVAYHEHLALVQKEDAVISSIEMTNGQIYTGRVFIDCSYEGDLMAGAGVSYTWGRESTHIYDESLAGMRFMDDTLYGRTVTEDGRLHPFFVPYDPEIHIPGAGDKRVINYNFRPTMTRENANKVPLYKPEGYDRNDFLFLLDYVNSDSSIRLGKLVGLYRRLHNKAAFNNQQNSTVSLGMFGGNLAYPDGSYGVRDSITNAHKKYTLGYLYFLANDQDVPEKLRHEVAQWGFAKDEYVDNNNFPYYLYIREARRMVSDYVHTQHDIFDNRVKIDAVTLGSHWVDAHHIQRIALSDTSFINEGRIWEVTTKPFEIPYRIMTPRASECTNLIVPVCVSASHVGFCSIRLEPTWMQLGHVAGVAAAIALGHGQSVQEIDIAQLQHQLTLQEMICKISDMSVNH